MRLFFLNFVFAVSVFIANAQTDYSINAYRILSNVYGSKNADELKGAYSSSAVLMNLYQKSEPSMVIGAEEIYAYYAKFLNDFAVNKQQLELVFKISSRRFENDKVYDSGHYELVVNDANGSMNKYYGKFNTILVMENGQWVFEYDATTDSVDNDSFDKAEAKFNY